jgi:hypothetical protein
MKLTKSFGQGVVVAVACCTGMVTAAQERGSKKAKERAPDVRYEGVTTAAAAAPRTSSDMDTLGWTFRRATILHPVNAASGIPIGRQDTSRRP